MIINLPYLTRQYLLCKPSSYFLIVNYNTESKKLKCLKLHGAILLSHAICKSLVFNFG